MELSLIVVIIFFALCFLGIIVEIYGLNDKNDKNDEKEKKTKKTKKTIYSEASSTNAHFSIDSDNDVSIFIHIHKENKP